MGHGRLNMFRSLRYVFLYLRLFRFLFKDKFALHDDKVIITFSDMPFASAIYFYNSNLLPYLIYVFIFSFKNLIY